MAYAGMGNLCSKPKRIVASDVAMPVMSGRELGDKLARTHPSLPVLYMSGVADDEIISRDLLEPGRPFIQKPFASELFAQPRG